MIWADDISWTLAPVPAGEEAVVEDYRLVAQQAIHALHRSMEENKRLERAYHSVREELRRYMAWITLDGSPRTWPTTTDQDGA